MHSVSSHEEDWGEEVSLEVEKSREENGEDFPVTLDALMVLAVLPRKVSTYSAIYGMSSLDSKKVSNYTFGERGYDTTLIMYSD